ncbi:MAG: flagellar biosynthetic protein FliO [Desulforhabdus sp.]|jgi:flagellar biosynthetic protein FliO|nr:flagellar biosynthetic protein FliO [Desulforhabdus sp.]
METGFEFGPQLLRVLSSLALVLGILGIAVYGIKRFGLRVKKPESSPWIQVIARYPLGIKHYLLLVEVKNQLVLLGVSPQGVHFLTMIPESSEPHSGTAP